MLYQITGGTVSLGGQTVLDHIDFEIKGNEKIAVTGKNGAGKTTLLRLIAGELELDRDDKRESPGIFLSRKLTVGMLTQQPRFAEYGRTVEELLLDGCSAKDTFSPERYDYEREYDTIFTRFGFSKEDKGRKLSEFSGGQQTRISLIRLLLEKPDILLLDEPTNHLDLETIRWLEGYIRHYEHAVVMVSHDRFFLDQTAEIVYELDGRKLRRYPGNYTDYRREKLKQIALQTKAYERQQEEIRRLNSLIERFKHKPTKAAFARSRKKLLERMPLAEKPAADDVHIFTGPITPLVPPSKWVLEAEHLKIGYDSPLLGMNLRIRRGQKIGILGPNGAGKTTFLRTVAGHLPPLSGRFRLGNNISIGYFDQHSAEITSDLTVSEHFHRPFPALTDKEVRSILGAYLFTGRTAGRKVTSLSGGEKSRLVLAELLQSRPNFLVLDEPTNHMDIQAKETLESAFRAYEGTILFVSHDRYFIRQVAESILIFENESVLYYPFDYQHYLERLEKARQNPSISGGAIPGSTASGGAVPDRDIPACISAEDQALIAGIRSVPKAERQQLREIPTEEAYTDWQLRLAREKMAAAGSLAEQLWKKLEAAKEAFTAQEYLRTWSLPQETPASTDSSAPTVFPAPERSIAPVPAVSPVPKGSLPEQQYLRLKQEYAAAWQAWYEACLEWYDAFCSCYESD